MRQTLFDWHSPKDGRSKKLNLLDGLRAVAVKAKSRRLQRLAALIAGIDARARNSATCEGTRYEIGLLSSQVEETVKRAASDATAAVDAGTWLGFTMPNDRPPLIDVEKCGQRYVSDVIRREQEGRKRKSKDGAEWFVPREFEPVFRWRIFWDELSERVEILTAIVCPGQTDCLTVTHKQSVTDKQLVCDTSIQRKERKEAQTPLSDVFRKFIEEGNAE